jgi:hypothetical protein
VTLHLPGAAANPAASLPSIPEWRSFWAANQQVRMPNAIEASRMDKNQPVIDAWQRQLKVKIALALAAKLLGLVLLWFLFFRGHG